MGAGYARTPTKKGFDQTLALQGISFRVSSPNVGSINTKVDGTITGAEIADLNSDGWPELMKLKSNP